MSMKAAAGEQEGLLAIGHPFFKPKYVGSKGWIGIVIDDDTDWDEVRELVTDSFVVVAPKDPRPHRLQALTVQLGRDGFGAWHRRRRGLGRWVSAEV